MSDFWASLISWRARSMDPDRRRLQLALAVLRLVEAYDGAATAWAQRYARARPPCGCDGAPLPAGQIDAALERRRPAAELRRAGHTGACARWRLGGAAAGYGEAALRAAIEREDWRGAYRATRRALACERAYTGAAPRAFRPLLVALGEVIRCAVELRAAEASADPAAPPP